MWIYFIEYSQTALTVWFVAERDCGHITDFILYSEAPSNYGTPTSQLWPLSQARLPHNIGARATSLFMHD